MLPPPQKIASAFRIARSGSRASWSDWSSKPSSANAARAFAA